MAIRRLNFTERKRLRQTDIRIVVNRGAGSAATFDAELDLGNYGLPDNALVFVEAYRQTAWMRFDFGMIGLLRAPENRHLIEFDSPDAILFRVRVTAGTGEKGLLLAEADGIRTQDPDEQEGKRVPLLPVKSDAGLGEQVYKVDFSDRPILLVNKKVGDWRGAVSDPVFVALVFPSVLREILTRILKVDEYDDPEDPDDWHAQWLRLALRLNGNREVPDTKKTEDLEDWIDDAVLSFANRFRTLKRFQSAWEGGTNS